MPINDGKYVVPAWQDGGPPAIDAAELTDIGQSIVTNQNGIAQNTQNVSTLQQQMSTANQNIASLQQFQTTATGQIANLTNNYLPKAGGTMTGPITLPGNPSGALQAVPKQYVDAATTHAYKLISRYTGSDLNNIPLPQLSYEYFGLVIVINSYNVTMTTAATSESARLVLMAQDGSDFVLWYGKVTNSAPVALKNPHKASFTFFQQTRNSVGGNDYNEQYFGSSDSNVEIRFTDTKLRLRTGTQDDATVSGNIDISFYAC